METPDWFLDELAHAGNEHLDADYIAGYDQKAGNDPADDLALLRNLGLDSAHTLIDFGAGTGTFALAAAPHCRRVVAVDVSPAMLARLREKAAHVGVENVEIVEGGFLSYQHQGDLADFVYSRHALHHLPDFWKTLALQRIAAMMNPGGVLYLSDLIFSFEPNEAEQVIGNWLALAPELPGKGWTRAELQIHLHEEYSTFSWLLEPMLEHAGFRIQQVHHTESRVRSAYVCIKK